MAKEEKIGYFLSLQMKSCSVKIAFGCWNVGTAYNSSPDNLGSNLVINRRLLREVCTAYSIEKASTKKKRL